MSDVMPEDDLSITDETLLYRLVPRVQIVSDSNLGRYRPSTNAFKKTTKTNRMSVVLGDSLHEQERDPLELVSELRTAGSLSAEFARSCEQVLARRPTEDEPAHGDVIGPDRKPLLKKLACEAACVEGDWEAARTPG